MSVLDRICRFPYKGESGLIVPGREGNVMERQRWKDSAGVESGDHAQNYAKSL